MNVSEILGLGSEKRDIVVRQWGEDILSEIESRIPDKLLQELIELKGKSPEEMVET